jgi:glycosyltransferase involved in cell wall biosynthesis
MKNVRSADQRLSVCALVPYPADTTPSQRFRIEQWMPYLESHGIAVDLLPFADQELMAMLHKPGRQGAKAVASIGRFLRRFGDAFRTRRYDAVLVHRAACIAGPATIERLVVSLGRPVIYDFDDAIFKLHTTDANRRFGWLKFPGKTRTICGISDHVVVGNSYLAEYALKYNSRVTVIPTSIDAALYRPEKKNRSNGKIVVGWTGSSTSQTHLEMFAQTLRQLLARRDVEFRVISDREPVLPGISYVWRAWSPQTEVQDLSDFDIGIMPIPDDEWARGKCALKALQYMAMGVPAICSPVGANNEVIQHGDNGFLASSTAEWISCFETLVDDSRLRHRLGANARLTVERSYSMNRCAELFAGVVDETVERHRSSTEVVDRPVLTPHLPTAIKENREN